MEKKEDQKINENLELVKLCGEYCKILDKAEKTEFCEFLETVASKMMAIYKQTFEITRFQTRYESDPEKFLTEKQYNKLLKKLKEVFGKKDSYNEIIDPSRPASHAIFQASLSEDLTDIYQDLFDFAEWYSLGTLESINDSVIECLNNFEKYWGIKLLNALRAIHVIRYYLKDASVYHSRKDEEVGDDVTENEVVDPDGLDEFLTEEL